MPQDNRKVSRAALYVMAIFYVGAGANHFVHPASYTVIVPGWLPHHLALVYLSGIAEITCGGLLLPARTRSIGAWLLIALLVAVFPANIQMLLNYYHANNPALWVTIVRLPIQILLIWWAWTYTRPNAIRKTQ